VTDVTAAIMEELLPLLARQRRHMAARWCDRSLSMIHLHVLLVLDTEGALPMSRLAEVLDVSLSSATGIVTRMEERGLIERARHASDRRQVLVDLCPQGRQIIEEMDVLRVPHLGRVVEELSPDAQTNVLRAVRDIRDAHERVQAREAEAPEPLSTAAR
jgi:DNA-binding MarR family transcriptional regulator